jgi:formyltetrahydrofolate-dependent phosphoribosylglycinamide formyltransferase
VFTSGCFDVLHAGHVRYLEQARALGGALCVALNSDASVRQLKGPSRPVNTQEDRAEVLLALRSVDAVVIFDDLRTTHLIRTIRPHIFAKGGDYTVDSLNPEERAALDGVGAQIHILPEVKGKSTSATLRKMAQPERKLRLAVLGSGKGTNFQAIADAIRAGNLAAEIALVISDRADAEILRRAEKLGIAAAHVPAGAPRAGLSPAAEKEIRDRLQAAGVDWVILAGFMRIVGAQLLSAYPRRILNLHPSLLPRHPGLGAVAKALGSGDAEAGCTVHLVDAGIDTGEILGQRRVPVVPGDTEQSLYARIQEAEHLLLPEVIGKLPLP